MVFPWKEYEAAIVRGAEKGVREVMDKHEGHFYAVAFHAFYAELDGQIQLPLLATNTLEQQAKGGYSKWSPPDWKWSKIKYTDAALKKMHREMEKLAHNDEEELWQATEQLFMDAMIRAIKTVAAELKKHKKAAADFVGIVETEHDEIKNLQKCVTPAQFKKLFPQIVARLDEAKRIDASSTDEKLAKYRERLSRHCEEIVKLGEAAIPMLLEMLDDPQEGWTAANLLGRIGIAEPQVIAALRQRANSPSANIHLTSSLALLGDVEFVLNLAHDESVRTFAIRGIESLYLSESRECGRKIPLDYRPLERLLTIADCEQRVEPFPGRTAGYAAGIEVADVSEALRGLESKHTLIREHALCILGNRRLGTKLGAQILPAITARLNDQVANVRRLAIITLADWKKAARPYLEEIRNRFQDPDPKVAEFARVFIKEIE